MKDMAQVREIKKRFTNQYRTKIEALGNHLSVGIGTNEVGEFTLRANLESSVGKENLPHEFEGMSVVVSVIGEIHAQDETNTITTINTVAGRFAAEFKGELERLGNKMGVGVGRDGSGKASIYAYLENGKGADSLPLEFEGVEVVVKVIGEVSLA